MGKELTPGVVVKVQAPDGPMDALVEKAFYIENSRLYLVRDMNYEPGLPMDGTETVQMRKETTED